MKVRKSFKLNVEVGEVLALVAARTNNTDTRMVEVALIAYAAKILGPGSVPLELARIKLLGEVNKNRKT